MAKEDKMNTDLVRTDTQRVSDETLLLSIHGSPAVIENTVPNLSRPIDQIEARSIGASPDIPILFVVVGHWRRKTYHRSDAGF